MLKKYAASILLSLCLLTVTSAQTPCDTTSGMAGIYPCNDYDLMSQIPITTLASTLIAGPNGAVEGSDIWGWTDPISGKEYAIVGTTNSTAFVDVSDPVNPVFLGRIDTATGQTHYWRDVKVYNNYAFIVADGTGAHGMQIFDLTRLRTEVNPINDTYAADLTYTGDGGAGDLVIGSCHNIVINESEGVAYLVGCSSANGGGPIFVDISNPLSPTTLGDYTAGGYSHDAQVVTYTGPDSDHTGKQIYIGSNGNTDKVVILDVTDKGNVIPINQFTYPQTSYAHQGWFTDNQRYFIMGDEVDEQAFGNNTKTLIFDLQDLDAVIDNPLLNLINTYFGPTLAIDHNGYVDGNNFYLANYRAGLRVLDVSVLTSASNSTAEIGYFDTYPSSNSANFNGTWSVYPYFLSGNIIISDIEGGLFIVRKSNTLGLESFPSKDSFSLSPNPTTDVAVVKASTNAEINSIDIYNILGQKLFSKNNMKGQEFVLPIAQFSKGLYLIKINQAITKKLILK